MIVCRIWRQHPQVPRHRLIPVGRVRNPDFSGIYGHVAFGINILIGVELRAQRKV